MRDYLLALDLGTTHCKATLYSLRGELIGETVAPIATRSSVQGWVEQDPADWIAACERVITPVAHQYRGAIRAMGLTSRMGSLLYLDHADRPLGPATLYADTRAAAQRDALIRTTDVVEALGLNLLSTLPRMMWMRAHRPEVVRASARVCGAKDFIGAWLTGTYATDFSNGPGVVSWPDLALELAGVSSQALPAIVPPTTMLGSLRPAVADRLGLPPAIPVVIGASDGACANLGVAASGPGDVCISLSTTGAIRWASVAPPPVASLVRMAGFAYRLDHGHWFWGGALTSVGTALSWLQSVLGAERFDAVTAQAALIPAGSEGVLFAPYLQGMYSPEYRPKQRAAFDGLALHHGRHHLVRAVMEGVAYSLRAVMDALSEQATDAQRMAITGGAAQLPLWRQITADVLGRDLVYHANGTPLGAAMLAAVGAGLYPTLGEAQRTMIDAEIPVAAGPDAVLYAEHYHRFRQVVGLKEIYANT